MPTHVTKKKREFTVADLQAMAEQLGGRLRFGLVPQEYHVCEGCGRSSERVKNLIQFDSGLAICDRCVGVCNDMIAKSDAERAQASAEAQTGDGARAPVGQSEPGND